MKKILALVTALAIMTSSFAAFPVFDKPTKKASDIMIPVGKTGQTISLQDLSQISVADFQKLTGSKMRLVEKAGFKIAQRDLRKSINNDGTFNSKKVNKFMKKAEGSSFNLGGFALGFLLGPIGILIAFIISDDNRRARTKWALIGFLAWLAIVLLLFVL